MAPLELATAADERIDARGNIVRELNTSALRVALAKLARTGIEASTVSLINSFTNDVHERRMPDVKLHGTL